MVRPQAACDKSYRGMGVPARPQQTLPIPVSGGRRGTSRGGFRACELFSPPSGWIAINGDSVEKDRTKRPTTASGWVGHPGVGVAHRVVKQPNGRPSWYAAGAAIDKHEWLRRPGRQRRDRGPSDPGTPSRFGEGQGERPDPPTTHNAAVIIECLLGHS
jgi:hypothetical protein